MAWPRPTPPCPARCACRITTRRSDSAVYMELAADGNVAANARQSLQKLTTAGYPVTAVSMKTQRGDLTEDDRPELARWIDTLDRF